MAKGIVMGLASKKPALFSQYRRAAEIPVLVSQYSVMLSRMSSRCQGAVQLSRKGLFHQPGLAAAVAVVEHERGQVGG